MKASLIHQYAVVNFGIVGITDAEGVIEEVNDLFCSISQYSRDELLGQKFSLINSQYHSPEFWQELWKTIGSGQTWRGEIRNQAKDGSYFWVDAMIIPITDEASGKKKGYFTLQINITRRKEREREAQLLAIVTRNTNSGVVITNMSGEIEWVNDSFEEMSGYTLEEIYGKKPGEVLQGPETDQATVAYMSKHVEEGLPWYAEVLNYRKDGSPYWISIQCQKLEEEGSPDRLMAIQQDITQRKDIEQGILESETRFRDLADNAPVMIWLKDEEQRITFVNETWEKFRGRTGDEDRNRKFLEGVHPEDRDRLCEIEDKAYIQAKGYEIEYRILSADKNYHWILERATPRFTTQGDLVGYLGSSTDITDLKQYQHRLAAARQAISESENRLTAFFNSTTDVNFLLDFDYRILDYNLVAEKLISEIYSRKVERGDNMLDFLLQHDRKPFERYFQNALRGTPSQIEQEVKYPKDIRYVWRIAFNPARNREGEIIGVAFNATDITQIKDAENRMRRKNELLEKIAHIQSHDIRRPVASLMGLFNLFRPTSLDPLNEEVFFHMKKVIQEIDDVIHQVVELTYDEDLDIDPSIHDMDTRAQIPRF